MAEQLGEASLRIVVDDSALRQGLADAKALVERELGGTFQQAGQRATRGGRAGGGRVGRQAAEGINSEIAANRTLRQLRSNLNRLEAAGVNTVQLRTRYFQIEKQIADGLFGSARRNSDLLKQSIADEKIRLDLQRQQAKAVDAAAKSGRGTGPSSPIRGNRLIPGSPANIEFLARQGGPTSPIRGGAAFPGSPIALEKAAAAERKLARERERTAKQTQKTAETERKDAKRRRDDILSNALIGGAFPALFGQGLGASLGGAVGGGLGGAAGGQFGFGLSLIGTALGAQFDVALQKAQTLAKGLDNPIKNFDALRESALLSSRALEKQVEALIASGRTTEAEILLRQDLANIFGDATAATEYTNNVDRLNRSFSQGTTILANFVAGPLAKFLESFTRPAQGIQLGLRVQERASQLSPLQQAQLGQFERQQRQQLPAQPSDEQKIQFYLSVLREIDRITGQAAKTEAELLAVRQASIKAQQAEQRIIVQRAYGVEDVAASAEVQALRQRQNTLIPGFTGKSAQEQEKAVQELRRKNQESAQAILDLRNQEIAAAARLLQLDEQRQLRNEELFRSVLGTSQLLSVQPGAYRDTLRFTQQITEQLVKAADVQATNLRNIEVARTALGAPDSSNAADQERLLEKERQVRLEYVDAAAKVRLSLIEAAERLKLAFRDAVLNFTQIRSSAEGLNRFLTPAQQEGRALANFDLLLPLFRQAQQRFTELTGARAPELVAGSAEDLNAGIRDFINAVNREEEAGRTLVDTQKSLRDVNQSIVTVNERLVSATQALADKNWVVDVQVINQAGGATTVNAINALAQ